MRFKPLARRITLAPTLVVALALTVAACSSSFQHVRCHLAIRSERSGLPGPRFGTRQFVRPEHRR